MNILKLTDKPAELEAVKDKVLEELQYLRSLDTAGDGGHSLTYTHMKLFPLFHQTTEDTFTSFTPTLAPMCVFFKHGKAC